MTKIFISVEVKEEMKLDLQECLMCGSTKDLTLHHVIPKSMLPKRNVLVPLCVEHKDLVHPIVKQIYLPKKLRHKISKVKKQVDNLTKCVTSLRNDIDFNKRNLYSSVCVSPLPKQNE
jgi:hypothetical protein